MIEWSILFILMRTASSNIGSALKEILDLKETESVGGLPTFSDGKVKMLEIKGRLVDAEYLNDLVDDVTIFLSRHSSNKGIPAFTVHAEGNWSNENSLGGRPKSLADPRHLRCLVF